MAKTLTVGDLRRAIEGVPDDMECILRIMGEEGIDTRVCGLHGAAVEAGCTETDALMLDGAEEDDESAPEV